MLRHRSGPIAALFVAVVVVVAGVVAFATGDVRFSLRLVYWGGYWGFGGPERGFDPGFAVTLVLVGLLQAWALWQLLPGRHAGRGGEPGRRRGAVGWEEWSLRVALCAWAATALADRLPWDGFPEELAQLAVVVLFHLVMRGVSRPLRLAALAAGLCRPVVSIVGMALELSGNDSGSLLWSSGPPANVLWLVWTVLILVAQAKDGRWRRGTLWAGAAAAAGSLLAPGLLPPDPGSLLEGASAWQEGVGLATSVLTAVWLVRSARELGDRPGEPRPSAPAIPPGRWPARAAAVLLPLAPAVVNMTDGVLTWIGPRGAIASWFATDGWYLRSLWSSLDVLVGVGGATGLVLAAVLVRTRRLLLGTIWALLLTAAMGVASALTAGDGGAYGAEGHPAALFRASDSIRVLGLDGVPPAEMTGISPLWYSAALAGSALLLTLTSAYREGGPGRTAAASLATAALLALAARE
ncbi:hypothetical protein [Nonomuraea sp. NPDC050783]|uniref:hypothetical protein n=1 Tax=Nonomuraea sp. NPDC050783 TaxID=3154634 RepID=UPI003467A966